MDHVYAAIDLKSFYASVECHERGLDPLTTHLVVADQSRTDKTICLAISPSLKHYGLPGRARLFEVNQKVQEINAKRLRHAPLGVFLGKSSSATELANNPNLALDFIVAPPRMQYYLDYSTKIYQIYLQHVAPADLFAYSVDEIFCDLTSYLSSAKLTAADYVTKMIQAVYQQTGITATAGIGTNLFLAKVAMDILAKHASPNAAGVRIASLDESSFRQELWAHTPITDFWRVGPGYAKRLAKYNLLTMGDIARCSLTHSKLLYQLFGINAELLIDHAWGFENVTIHDIKKHRPETKSLSSGQVLSCPYDFTKAQVIVREMADSLALELVQKKLFTNHLTLHVEYDHENTKLNHPNSAVSIVTDHYHRSVPKPAHASCKLQTHTTSSRLLTRHFLELFRTNVNPAFTIRKISLAADDLIDLQTADVLSKEASTAPQQTDFFTDYKQLATRQKAQQASLRKESQIQKAILSIRSRYGKNAILRGTNFELGATGRHRHQQIGGHRA